MSNWIYINDLSNKHRFLLGEKGKKVLFCMGINPSYAEPTTLGKIDPTIRKVKAISSANGFDGWVMINVYPERNTKFRNLSKVGNPTIHKENLKNIHQILSQCEDIQIWVAFGNHIYDREYFQSYLLDIYELIQTKKPKWLSTAVNKSGSPAHPLYQRNNAKLMSFDMQTFIKNWGNSKMKKTEKKHLVYHHNMFGPSCEVAHLNNEEDFKIYCHLEHKICKPTKCNSCGYFFGDEEGKGKCCVWEETYDSVSDEHHPVQWDEAYFEFQRVENPEMYKDMMRMIEDGDLDLCNAWLDLD
ncbi:MAG: DUF1643 domain-containing protein [Ruminococcaceae bacterium]|nr:DUF1643 domain-containing protein [Oscillospiraceae bacterium]